MNLMSALWKRSRRRLFRAIVVLCALVAVTFGMAAIPAGPARAVQAITSGGPYAITYPGGDAVASFDVAGVDTATVSNFITTAWPGYVGLSSGASLSDLFQATWAKYSSLYASANTPEPPDPPSFSGGTVSVSSDSAGGSTVTFDIPAADVQANVNVPGWIQSILSVLAGAAAAVLTGATCELIVLAIGASALVVGGAITALGTSICSGLATAMWTFVSGIVGQAFSGTPWDSAFWIKIIAGTLAAAVAGAAVPALVPGARWVIDKVFKTVGDGIVGFCSFIANWVGNQWTKLSTAIKSFFNAGSAEVGTQLPTIIRRAGMPTPSGSGPIRMPAPAATRPPNLIGANCMDAYGSNGGASAGQIVAINSCNNNPAQEWDSYPSGMISVWGLCLDTKGGTSSSGTALVDLERCDGSPARHGPRPARRW